MKKAVVLSVIVLLMFSAIGCTKTGVEESGNEIEDQATIDDFIRTPESHYIGYITKMTEEERLFHFDKVEFLTMEDKERAAEIGIDTNLDMPSGFYIYNEDTYPAAFDVSEDTEYLILKYDEFGVSSEHKKVRKKELIEYNNNLENSVLFHIYTKDGYVTRIEEQYLP